MDLFLDRKKFSPSGIFGELSKADFEVIAVTLEHSYDGVPKLPPGVYQCKRGIHRLHSGPIETFEITGVPGHHGILFHVGNFQTDSDGCVLLGTAAESHSITESRIAFEKFMAIQSGVSEFTLSVTP